MSRSERYGYAHQKLRARWAVKVKAGNVHCWRCGCWLDPEQPWHLGHKDDDPTEYEGPECVRCNTSTAAVRGNKLRAHPTRWKL